MRIVKPDTTDVFKLLFGKADAWVLLKEVETNEIPADIPLSEKAIKWWEEHKHDSFAGLTSRAVSFNCPSDPLQTSDIISIISGAKRKHVRLGFNNFGDVFAYRILEKQRIHTTEEEKQKSDEGQV